MPSISPRNRNTVMDAFDGVQGPSRMRPPGKSGARPEDFNHPMFAPPPAGLTNLINLPSFGQITATQNEYYGGLDPLYCIGGPRSGQFTLKLQF
jgi:hypothetical protein